MNKRLTDHYMSPEHLQPLTKQDGVLCSADGVTFKINDGIPDFTWPQKLSDAELSARQSYDAMADGIYDAALDWQFAALYEDEDTFRAEMIELLNPQPQDRILEIGCGNGHDSVRIARTLSAEGTLFVQDLSPRMVSVCRENLSAAERDKPFACSVDYFVSTARYLPFESQSFDRIYHFGGFNEFGDKKDTLDEFARVVKPNGTITFGDESVGPWLRGTPFADIVINNNKLFAHTLPIDLLPSSAHDVRIDWKLGNCFYVITFRVGDGPPPLNLDLPHKGWRGGTMRSRLYGVLEGVHPDTKEIVRTAAEAAGMSVHEWLDKTLSSEAKKAIEDASN